MAPKAYATKADKAAKWNKTDDKKLLELINKDNDNGITLSREASNIRLIHRHWPHRAWKNFASLIRGKLEKIEIEGVLHGKRRGES